MGAVWSSLKWLLFGIMKSPTFAIDWARIHFQLAALQIKYMFLTPVSSPLEFVKVHYEIYNLLWNLELHHRLDVALNRRLGLANTLSSQLPHVDSLSNKQHSSAQAKALEKPSNLSFGQIFPAELQDKLHHSMRVRDTPIFADLVLVGGGHSHVYVLKGLGMNPIPGVRVTLINTNYETPYSGMLPGYVAGIYKKDESHIDVARLGAFCNATFIKGSACKIDRKERLIYFENDSRPPIQYDVLSIDIGSSPSMPVLENIIGASVPVTPVKPISKFGQRWEQVLQKIERSMFISSTETDYDSCESNKKIKIAVVGAGAGGVDLVLSLRRRVGLIVQAFYTKNQSKCPVSVSFVIISKHSALLPNHNKHSQRVIAQIMKENDIDVYLNFEVVSVCNNQLVSRQKQVVAVDEVFWCTNATAPTWIKESGFDCNTQGFINVNRSLESTNTLNVFAAGDINNIVSDPCPKAGVFAVRQGPVLLSNLKIALSSFRSAKHQLKPSFNEYIPQRKFLGIIGTGKRSCVATKGDMVIRDDWLFDLKDWIDRSWMAGYTSNLPRMFDKPALLRNLSNLSTADSLVAKSFMRCGGCGSKVGSTILSRVLKRLASDFIDRDEVLIGVKEADDVAVVDYNLNSTATDTKIAKNKRNIVNVHTIDFFKSFINDPFIFGKIVTNHALSDIYAKCAEPVTALALCVVPFQEEHKVENQLYDLLRGCSEVLKKANCSLVGGHTSESSNNEISMGLSINGTVSKNLFVRKTGARVGNKIILTKAIGTGVIFAANMQLKAKSIWIENAIEHMLISNKSGATILYNTGKATSCTDVTGFGFIGHLIEMLKNEETPISAEIYLDSIALLDGAVECVNAGVFSSLHEDNLRSRNVVRNHSEVCNDVVYQLLFDPQTSGGMLATVSEEHVAETILQLRKHGYEYASVVGEIVPQFDHDFLLSFI